MKNNPSFELRILPNIYVGTYMNANENTYLQICVNVNFNKKAIGMYMTWKTKLDTVKTF